MERTRNTVIRVTVYCLLIVFLIAIVNLQISMNELEETIDDQKKEIVTLEDDIAEYEMLLAEEKDDAYYERRARQIIFYNDYAE